MLGGLYMRIAMCDDEVLTLTSLKEVISQEFENNNLLNNQIDAFNNGYELLNEYKKQPYDVIFLDIKMPEINGFEIAAALREISCKTFIIFVTTESELVFNSFDFQPFHFIRKYPPEYLKIQLKNFIKKLSRHMKQTESIILELPYSEKKKIIIGDIVYISSEKNYLIYHLLKSEIKVRGNLTEAYRKYNAYDFVRTHNRFLVNMKNNAIVNIGRLYKKDLNEHYSLYLRSLR